MTRKNRTIKFLSSLVIILMLVPVVVFFTPQKASAFWGVWDVGVSFDPPAEEASWLSQLWQEITSGSTVTNTGLHFKDVARDVLAEVARSVARKALAEMTKSTVNWINSGFHGTPLFVENPDLFFKDIAKSEVKILINKFGYDPRRFPFGKAFALNLINSYKSTLDTNAAYSLSTVINDPAVLYNYQNNFAYGGWNGFLVNTQYPQNNYLGFKMKATDELARKIAGTEQNSAQRVQALLQQGNGFLSPQTCPSNPNYPPATNPYNPPVFDQATFDQEHMHITADGEGIEPDANYDTQLAAAKTAWNKKYSCKHADGTSALVNTTPGAVVASQITKALGVSQDQASLGAAVGSSLAAVFNALLAHFLDKGLNSLASKVNPKPVPDNFTYNGETLGSPADSTNASWDGGPDQPIVLNDFKKMIGDGITNTSAELKLMDSDDPTNPGIKQTLAAIWPKAQKLDACIPGPDVGWQDRLRDEHNRIEKIINTASSNGNDSGAADPVLKELTFAVKFFQDWINNKMIAELPDSILYMDAVNDIHVLSQQSDELTDKMRLKRQALARLQAIKTTLDTIPTQPTAGSANELKMVSLWKQYQGVKVDISTSIGVEETRNELNSSKDKSNKLYNPATKTGLIADCEKERVTKGWAVPGGPTSLLGAAQAPTSTGVIPNSEKGLFCDLPIIGGYTHGTATGSNGDGVFTGPNTTKPELPMVNAENVFTYNSITIKSVLKNAFTNMGLGSNSKKAHISVHMSCNTIFNAQILDYKGNLPGLTNPALLAPVVNPPDDTGAANLGTCTYFDGSDPNVGMSRDDCAANGGTWTPPTP